MMHVLELKVLRVSGRRSLPYNTGICHINLPLPNVESAAARSSLEVNVKDVNVVLREKEMDIVRIRREIEALRFAIPLLSDDRPLADDETSELSYPSFSRPELLEGKAGGDDSPSCLAKLHVYPGSTLY
jgi:hypothetical protein